MLLSSPCTVFRSTCIAAIACSTMACEPMTPSGKPLSAVPVAAVSTGSSGPAAADSRFSDPVELKSEDLRVKADDSDSSGGGEIRAGAAVSPAPATAPAAAAPAAVETASVAAPAPAAVAVAPAAAAASSSWPVRLVRTHLDEQPPSAVLAMPDGRRVVVSPGDMVPERGLVVMAIGRERVQLAQVSGVGDHATITPVELAAQY